MLGSWKWRTAALAALALAGCGGAPEHGGAMAVEDAAGREVRLEAPAQRVISLIPSVTDVIVSLGAAGRLVARTDYDTDPRLADLPSVGGGLTPSLEWLASREPDVVIAWPDATSRSVVSRLEALDIPVYAAASETIADALKVTADLGVLLGLQHAADSLTAYIEDGLDAVRRAVAGQPRPTVLYLIGRDPIMAAGPGTFVDELIRVAGGRNVLDDLGILWPQVALEEVVRRDPDIIVVAQAPMEADLLRHLRAAPGWRALTAVAEGRVYQVDPYTFNRPAPSMVGAAIRLAQLFHQVDASVPREVAGAAGAGRGIEARTPATSAATGPTAMPAVGP